MNEKEKRKEPNDEHRGAMGTGFERLKRKNSARLMRRRVFYFLLLISLLAIFAIACLAIFFRVSSIDVKGNTAYEDEEIIEASGIEYNMNLYLIDDSSVEHSILAEFPYVKTVKVNRTIPNGVTLNLKCDTPNYYTEIEGEYYVLSSELRVIERFFTKEELLGSHPEIKKLTGGEVESAIVGDELVFVNEAYSETGRELIAILENTEVYSGVSWVDFSDRFNIRIIYDSRLKANIGNSDETELKLRFMNEIVKDLGDARGTIDIKDVDAAYVLLDSNALYE